MEYTVGQYALSIVFGLAVAGAALGRRTRFHRVSGLITQFLLIILYYFLSENVGVFPTGPRTYSWDFFLFVCLILLAAALLTTRKNKAHTVLNRHQTDEWKGWMQLVFLLYHYVHAMAVYNAIRVFVSCFFWMTGFGNFLFFVEKKDYSLVRFAGMMWRLNLLCFVSMLATGNGYMEYYIVPLTSFFYCVVFASMSAFRSLNGTRWVAAKMVILAVLLFMIWDMKVFEFVRYSLLEPLLRVNFHEFHFRSYLDHFSALFGMVFAYALPQLNERLLTVESMPRAREVVIKGVAGTGLVLACVAWYLNIFTASKLAYNQMHPYTFFIPVAAFLYFRHLTPTMRSTTLGVFCFAGQISLELFIGQFHILMTNNAKSVLILVPGHPLVNLCVVSVVFGLCSWRLSQLTGDLKTVCVPRTHAKLVLRMRIGAIFAFAIGVVAWLLHWLELGLLLVAVCTAVCGVTAVMLAPHVKLYAPVEAAAQVSSHAEGS